MGRGGPDSVLDLLRASTSYLEGRGVESPRLDSELLMAEVLGLDRLQLYINFDRPVSGAERDALRELVKRRAAREPVALILGNKEFRSRPFHVPAGVLVPRPDTELLAELAVEALGDREDAPLVFDLGCGSGILSVAATLLGAERAFGFDIDPNSEVAAISMGSSTGAGGDESVCVWVCLCLCCTLRRPMMVYRGIQ